MEFVLLYIRSFKFIFINKFFENHSTAGTFINRLAIVAKTSENHFPFPFFKSNYHSAKQFPLSAIRTFLRKQKQMRSKNSLLNNSVIDFKIEHQLFLVACSKARYIISRVTPTAAPIMIPSCAP